MNDTTYLLDESLTKLVEIKSIQDEMALPNWSTQPKEYKDSKLKTFSTAERVASSCLSLGKETVNMLLYLTTEPKLVDLFMEPYIIERLSAMMDYNLAALVGPRCTELKVKSPEKYHFEPKGLLSSLLKLYLNLSNRTEFIASVARDGRSYKKELFIRASQIMDKNALMDSAQLNKVSEFVIQVEKVIVQDLQIEQDLGDIPDEFLDPLMCTLMIDPVILPTSKITVDRSTIISHLLSDLHDPFNRMDLTLDSVIPDVELKQRIEDWKKSMRK